MYTNNGIYQHPYYQAMPLYNPNMIYYPYPLYSFTPPIYDPNILSPSMNRGSLEDNIAVDYFLDDFFEYGRANMMDLNKDYGPAPFVTDIEKATEQNTYFRNTLWTGKNLQLTLMSINPGEDVGLEIHPDHDQFIRIEEGNGVTKMGSAEDKLTFEQPISDNSIVLVPAGMWHNIINTGTKPLKLYSIYAPPEHPKGTIHKTKAQADVEGD